MHCRNASLHRPLLALAIALALAAPLTAHAVDAGQVKVRKGTAHIEREGKRLPADVGSAVMEHDTVVTGANGSVGITFADGSLLSAGPNSVLEIERFNFNAVTNQGEFDSRLKKGTLTAVSGRIVKQTPGAMRVKTPAAIMGVRGTEFAVQVADGAK
jgi:hypothetical protein